MLEPLNELALFAGAGGGILGGKLLGWRTVCAVELDAHCASVLAQRQNDGCLHPFPIWSDVRSFDGGPWDGLVDVVSGGFPCQDISPAGKGAGIGGERSGLWREFVRIVREVRPRIVYVENSSALTTRGLDVVLGDLAALGFDAEWGVLGADAVGFPHGRQRMWICATHPQWCERWQEPHDGPSRRMGGGSSNPLRGTVIGSMCSPEFEELVMGWPIGWTELTPYEMARFREWQREHSSCSPNEQEAKAA